MMPKLIAGAVAPQSRMWRLVAVFALVLATLLPGPLVARADDGGRAQDRSLSATGGAIAYLTGWPQAAGASGRTVTKNEEVVVQQLQSDWSVITGGTLIASHVSNTTFGPAGFSGTSHGKFTIYVGPNAYQGSYESKISTALDQGCLVRDLGTWSLNAGGAQAHGALDVCLAPVDWANPLAGVFVGSATMNGWHN